MLENLVELKLKKRHILNKKKLILFQFLGPNKQFFNEDGADNRNQFIRYLKRDFKSAGYTSEPLKNQKLKNVYAILFFDLHSVYPIYGNIYKKFKFLIFNKLRSDTSSRNIFHEEKKLGIRIKKFLIAFEPRIICPDNFNFKYASLFDKTFFKPVTFSFSSTNNIRFPMDLLEIRFL